MRVGHLFEQDLCGGAVAGVRGGDDRIDRWQYANGWPPRPRIQPGTGSSGRTAAHSVSVMSVG
ncbi:hypothetical protein ACWGDT_37385 [Streptomyces avermitilis]